MNSPGRGELRVVSINRSRSALSADDHEIYGAGIEQRANVFLAIEAHELLRKICRNPIDNCDLANGEPPRLA